LLGPDGPVSLPGGAVAVPAGGARDVVVQGVPDGTYAAVVSADVPIVAGALSGRTRARGDLAGTTAGYGTEVPPADLAWTAGAGDIPARPTPLAVPGRGDAVLSLAAPAGAATLTYRTIGPTGELGEPSTVRVEAHSTAELTVPPDIAGIRLSAQGRLVAALVVADQDGSGPLLATVPVVGQPVGGVTAGQAQEDPRLGLEE
jgi:hypothetical protein